MTLSLRQDLGAVTVTNGFGLPQQPPVRQQAENVARLIQSGQDASPRKYELVGVGS